MTDEATDMSMDAMTSGPSVIAQGFHYDPEKHLYTLDAKPIIGVSAAVERTGHTKEFNEAAALKAEKGTNIHKWLEHADRGELHKWKAPPEFVEVYMRQWEAALRYMGVDGWVQIQKRWANDTDGPAIERSWYWQHSLTDGLQVAGTIDRLAALRDGRVALLDIKTTTGSRIKAYKVKMALYKLIFPCDLKIVVYLTGKDDWKPEDWIDLYDDPEDDAEAMRVLQSLRWRGHKAKRTAFVPSSVEADTPF